MITEKALSKYVSIFKHKLGTQFRLREKLFLMLRKILLLNEEAHDWQIVTWEQMLKWSMGYKQFIRDKTCEKK